MDIRAALTEWIDSLARDDDTKSVYRRATQKFIDFHNFPEGFETSALTLDHYARYLTWINKTYESANTQAIYAIGPARFLQNLFKRELCSINPERVKAERRDRTLSQRPQLPQFPTEDIEKILCAAERIVEQSFEDENEKLRAYRDRAFFLTLADTGLRIHEAVALNRGDVNWQDRQAVITGKGRKEAVIRFSSRSMAALRDYFSARSKLDGAQGRPLTSLPVFAQHAKCSGKKVKRITTAAGRHIVKEWVGNILGPEAVGTITPHSFRHYFVTTVLKASRNLKLAQELARHSNINVTQRYVHLNDSELDEGYRKIFK